jgi:hypothetical protein
MAASRTSYQVVILTTRDLLSYYLSICPRRLGCSNSETPGQPPLSPCPPSSSLSRFLVSTAHSSPTCKYIPIFPGLTQHHYQEERATGIGWIHCFGTPLQHVPHERQRGGGSHTCTRNSSPSSLTSILLSTARGPLYAPVLRRRATAISSDASTTTCDTYTAAPNSSSAAFVTPTTSRDASSASLAASSAQVITSSQREGTQREGTQRAGTICSAQSRPTRPLRRSRTLLRQ